MEVKNTGEYDSFESLKKLFPVENAENMIVNKLIEERQEMKKEAQKSYKTKKVLQEQMEDIKTTAPQKIFTLLMDLQTAINDEDFDMANNIIFDVDNERNIMDTVADLIFVSNHSEITPVKRNTFIKLTRAQILAKAHDPKNSEYCFCPKCNRPLRTKSIIKHQQNTLICVEIKAGRAKTLELGRRKDASIGSYIAKKTLFDDVSDNDSEEDDM